jgi:hypothetical protein
VANTDEVLNLEAAALTGAVRLTWGVSSTAYLQSFLIVVTKNGEVTSRQTVSAAAREATVTALEGTGYVFNVEAIVAQGGKTVACNPLPAKPVEPPAEPPAPPSGANSCLPGVHINWEPELESTWHEAAETGAKVGRASGKLHALAAGAAKAGMHVNWLLTGPPASLASAIAEYAALSSELKGAIISIEWGNENWPGGVSPMSGIAYGESYVKAATEARTAGLLIPLLCQVRLAPGVGETWMAELVSVANLAESLKGNALASHPYNHDMMLAQREPANLASYTDTAGAEWGSQRWMKEQYYIQQHLGVTVPVAITENGVAAAPGVANSVGSGGWLAVAENAREYLEFIKVVKEGKVPASTLPGMAYTPILLFACWYDMYGNRQGGETFGLFFYEENGKPKGPNEEGSFFSTFKTAANALNVAA